MARKRRHPAPENHERWLLSYADFITLLLALFVVMFASSQPDKHKAQQVSSAVKEALANGAGGGGGGGPATALAPELMPAMKYLAQSLDEEIKTGRIEMHMDSRGLVISLREAAYFPSGGDEIAPSGIASLERIARTIRDLPNPVRLEGHTDSTPIHNRRFRSNWDLSAARSIAMLDLFANQYGIDSSRFAVTGYAETKPVDTNDSPEGRAHNRRVDIVILNQ